MDEYTNKLVVTGNEIPEPGEEGDLVCVLEMNGLTTERNAIFITAERVKCDIEHRNDLFNSDTSLATLSLKNLHP